MKKRQIEDSGGQVALENLTNPLRTLPGTGACWMSHALARRPSIPSLTMNGTMTWIRRFASSCLGTSVPSRAQQEGRELVEYLKSLW